MSVTREQRLIVSYLMMRRTIGILGISLPLIMLIGGLIDNSQVLQESISGYYYTNMRDFFVGILCIVALFLISYQGYERIDNIVNNLAGFCALGMIIFPTKVGNDLSERVGIFLFNSSVSGYLHLTFATIFFLTIAFNSFFLFTKRHSQIISKEKKRRNLFYKICGFLIVLQIVAIIIYMVFLKDTIIAKIHPILIFESIALLAFGTSWLIKGNTFFKDQINNYEQ